MATRSLGGIDIKFMADTSAAIAAMQALRAEVREVANAFKKASSDIARNTTKMADSVQRSFQKQAEAARNAQQAYDKQTQKMLSDANKMFGPTKSLGARAATALGQDPRLGLSVSQIRALDKAITDSGRTRAAAEVKYQKDVAKAAKERYDRTRQMAREGDKEWIGTTKMSQRMADAAQPRLGLSDAQRRAAEAGFTRMPFDEVLRHARAFGEGFTEYVTAPIMQFARESVAAFELFDQKMTESTSIMEVTTSQVAALREQAIQLSYQGPQSASTLAEGYYFLASAGYSAAQSLELLPAIQKFATAGAFNLAEAVTFASDAHRALGLAEKDEVKNRNNLVKVTDVLVKANSLVNANVRQLSIALTTQAAASLRTFHKSIEEGVAVLAAFAEQGVKAHIAGTTLSRVLRLLNQSALKNADTHARLGFHVFDAQGKMRNLADIVQNLEHILGPMNDEMRASTLAALGFEARIQQAILPLIGMSQKIREYEAVLKSAGGATENVSNKQMKSFHNQMQMVGNQITSLKIKVGELLAPTVLFFGKIIGDLAEALRSAHPALQTVLITFAGLLTIIGPVTVGLAALVLGWRYLVTLLPAGTVQMKLATAAATAFKFALIGIGVAIAGGTLVALANMVSGTADLNKELERSKELSTEVRDNYATMMRKTISTTSDQGDPTKRRGELKALQQGMEREAAGLLARREAVKKTLLADLTLENLAAARVEIEDLTKRYETMKEMIKLVGEELKKSGKAAEVLKQQTPDIIKDLEEQRDLFGLKGPALDVAKAKRKGGLPPEFEAMAADLVKALEVKEAQKDLKEDLEKTTQELRKQAETFGMTSEEAKVYELRMKGVKEVQLKELQALAANVKKKEEHKKLMDEAKKITEDSRTPLQKFNERMVELNKMFGMGMITKPIFLQAVEKAKNEFNEAATSAKKAKEEILKLDQVLFGSTEARARVEAFRDQYGMAARMGMTPDGKAAQLTLPPQLAGPVQPGKGGFDVKARQAVEDHDRTMTVELLKQAVKLLTAIKDKPEQRVRAAGL